MPRDTFEVRISLQKLLLGLVVVIVPLSLVGLYITADSSRYSIYLEEANGAQLRALARQASSGSVSRYEWIIWLWRLEALALSPALLDAVSAADRSIQHEGDAAIRSRMDASTVVEAGWSTPAADSLVKTILTLSGGNRRAYREVIPDS